jgi:hypothetical protein
MDVAVRVHAEAQFNAKPNPFELPALSAVEGNYTTLAQLGGQFKAHCQVKSAIQSADMNKLYIKNS